MNGSLPLPMPHGFKYEVIGGRYFDRPDHLFGVKMAVEINQPCDVSVPVRDFNVPTQEQMRQGVEATVAAIVAGKGTYVGCMGGIGRTGLMLACLAKTFGTSDPVLYVRKHYIPHAVETQKQMEFVAAFEPTAATLKMVKDAGRWLWLKKWFTKERQLTVAEEEIDYNA